MRTFCVGVWALASFHLACAAADPVDVGEVDAGSTFDATASDRGVGVDLGPGAADGGVVDRDSGPNDSGASAVCGNQAIEVGEACDDGNTTDGDGCSAACTTEGGALGCRSVVISAGEDGNDPDDSAYLNTALNPNNDISEFLNAGGWNPGGPLILCASAISGGKATLTLQADVTVAISLPLNNCLCRQYVAAGSEGSLYCQAGPAPLDFIATTDSMGAGPAGVTTVQAGAATVRGEGDLRITFQARAADLEAGPGDCTPAACAAAVAAEPLEPVEYTTGLASSEVSNPRQGGTAVISTSGRPFDDDPNDGTPDCEDWTRPGPLGVLAGGASFDEDNMDLGQAKDVVTIERVAE